MQLDEGIKALSVSLEGKVAVATIAKKYYIKDRQTKEPALLGRDSEGFISDILISEKDNQIFIASKHYGLYGTQTLGSKKRVEVDSLTCEK